MSYTPYQPAETELRDQVRGLIGDTIRNEGPRPYSGEDTNFADERIAKALTDHNDDVLLAAAALAHVLHAEWIRQAGEQRERWVVMNMKETAKGYKQLAEDLEDQANETTTMTAGIVSLTRTDAYSIAAESA